MAISPKRIKIILACWTLLSVAVGFNGCTRALDSQADPKPISKTNPPWHFDIVAFPESGDPLLLKPEFTVSRQRTYFSSDAEFRKAHSDVIWNDQGYNTTNYSFYIPRAKRADVEAALDTSYGSAPGVGVKIEILTDNPSAKQQTIRVDYDNDDSSFYSVYTVNGNTVTPIKYGDILRSDSYIAIFTGLRYMLVFYIAGRIALAIFLQWKTRSQAATSNQVQP